MASFGQRLKQAREERDLRLEDVSRTTRVRICHLEALERDDFESMPQDVFVKGFVRMYAECLGIDRGRLVEEYREERERQRPNWEKGGQDEVLQEMSRILEAPRVAGSDRTARMLKIAGGAVVVLAVLGVWWIGAGNREQAQLARAELGENVSRPPAPPIQVAANPPVRSLGNLPAKVTKPEPSPEIVPPPVDPVPVEIDPVPVKDPAPVEIEPILLEEPARAAPPPAAQLSVPDHGLGTGIHNRQLVGRSDRFVEGTEVWFWTRVVGGRQGDTIRHIWTHEGRESGRVPLTLGGEHWRTQSRKTLREGSAGHWVVEAVAVDGEVLARREFVCLAEPPSRPL